MQKYQPDYIYNLGAATFVFQSWNDVGSVYNVNFGGTLRCLEAIRKFNPNCRYIGASSSEIFGETKSDFQTLNTPPKPRNPYGGSKQAAQELVRMYREKYGLYAVSPILYTNVSCYSSKEFVFPKIISALVKFSKGSNETLKLGYLDARRAWFSSHDATDAIYRIANQDLYKGGKPKDYIVSANESRSVRDVVEKACEKLKISYIWQGEGLSEKLIHPTTGKIIVEVDQQFYNFENSFLVGDSSPLRQELGWEPKVSFEQLVEEMIAAETN